MPALPETLIETTIPPLRHGDRLSREEFRRRWDAMPQVKRAERFGGVVYMPAAAVRYREHGRPHWNVVGWLHHYETQTPGVEGGDASSVEMGPDDDPQPDALLLIAPECGGQCEFDEEGYLLGAPELIVEVAAASVRHDLGFKKRTYEAHGVQEYVVWLTERRQILWHRLVDGAFVEVPPDDAGVCRSTVFPGLWLDVPAMIAGDMRQVLAVLRKGLETPDHGNFVRTLEDRRTGPK